MHELGTIEISKFGASPYVGRQFIYDLIDLLDA